MPALRLLADAQKIPAPSMRSLIAAPELGTGIFLTIDSFGAIIPSHLRYTVANGGSDAMNWKRGACVMLLVTAALSVTVCLAAAGIAQALDADTAQIPTEPDSPRSPNIIDVLARELADNGMVRVLIHADELPQGRAIEITTPGKTVLQTLTVNDKHEVVTNGLQPGQYLAISEEIGAVLFSLHRNASVAVLGGKGWSDGEMVYMTTQQTGTVQVLRDLPISSVPAEDGVCYRYTLSGQGITTDRIIRFTTKTTQKDGFYQGSCTFAGLAAGEYELWENGTLLQRVSVTTDAPTAVEIGGKTQ